MGKKLTDRLDEFIDEFEEIDGDRDLLMLDDESMNEGVMPIIVEDKNGIEQLLMFCLNEGTA